MLLQVQNFRFWMKSKMGQRGAAITEYVVLLAFVCVIGYALLSSSTSGLSKSIGDVITKVTDMLGVASSTASNAASNAAPDAQ